MSKNFDNSKETFETSVLIKYASRDGKLNEATTRLRIIDTIFFDCLGWDKDDCTSEDSFEGQYTDYSFATEGVSLIVEAKKEGVYFELPTNCERVVKLKNLCRGNEALNSAVEQCLGYCQKRGVPIGIVFNGHQLVAFISSRQDGKPPIDGNAFVFNSLLDIGENFLEFWNNLSKPGVVNHNLYQTLKLVALTPPEKLSSKIFDYPGFKIRNSLQTELQILGGLFLEDLNKDPEIEKDFLENCYCPSGALSQYSLLSRKIIQTKYSSFLQEEIGVSMTSVNTKQGTSKELTQDILSASVSRRPIILLGEVGAGKTTFVRHFIKVEAEDILSKSLVLYIDFGKDPALPGELSDFVIDSCINQMKENYETDIMDKNFILGVYNLDLKNFRKNSLYSLRSKPNNDNTGISDDEFNFLEEKINNRAEHLRLSLEHISKGQKKQLVLFLDNIDQRPIEFQDRVYLIGHGLAETWPCTVFMSLRPETFFLSKREGSLTGYQPRVFTISPPRIDLVISKRLEFAIKNLKQGNKLYKQLEEGTSVKTENLASYLSIIQTSFKENRELIEFVDNVSGGNIRKVVDFLTSFIGSGHVNTEKILNIFETEGRYQIAVHEFFRAVLYGDNVYYNPEASPVPNLFNVNSPDGKEYFLTCILIGLIEREGKQGSEQGYVTSGKIYSFCQDLGFTPTQISLCLMHSLKNNLLESNPRFSPRKDKESVIYRYRVTSVGIYMIKKTISDFSYFDAMIVDTPIISAEVREKIADASTISERLDRAEIFCKYLDNEWSKLPSEQLQFDWGVASGSLKTSISKIRSTVEKQKSQVPS